MNPGLSRNCQRGVTPQLWPLPQGGKAGGKRIREPGNLPAVVREDVNQLGRQQMIILLLGGARSGKSALAERVASRCRKPVVYVAPAVVGEDADFAQRIRLHRNRRPVDWLTAETGEALVEHLMSVGPGTQLIDSLGSWVASTTDFVVDADGLCEALQGYDGDVVVVSEEVGMGVHPSTEIGGKFRDVMGTVNQRVAEVADEVYLVVAGMALRLSGLSLADEHSEGA